jgi:hypothetical protein
MGVFFFKIEVEHFCNSVLQEMACTGEQRKKK